MTPADLQSVLANLRLSPGRREMLKAELALLEGIARSTDPDRLITLGPRTAAALDRVTQDTSVVGVPRAV